MDFSLSGVSHSGRSLGLALLLMGLMGFPAPVFAEDTATQEPTLDARARTRLRAMRTRAELQANDELREEWQARYRTLLVQFRDVRAEGDAAAIERSKARQDQRRRGEDRVASDQRIEEAAMRTQETYDELVEFYERSRADAIERAWFVPVEDEFPDLEDALPERG